jgi:uncharacterized protein YjbJ (UPF0337 family)
VPGDTLGTQLAALTSGTLPNMSVKQTTKGEKMMNEAIIKGKWNEIKGEIRKSWGELTDNELEQAKGDLTSVEGLLQQHYGWSRDEAKRKLASVVERFSDSVENAKDSLRNSRDERERKANSDYSSKPF